MFRWMIRREINLGFLLLLILDLSKLIIPENIHKLITSGK
jgi:hypothetical protein